MALFTAEDYEPLPPGLYVGKLLDVEPRESANGEYRRTPTLPPISGRKRRLASGLRTC